MVQDWGAHASGVRCSASRRTHTFNELSRRIWSKGSVWFEVVAGTATTARETRALPIVVVLVFMFR
jgi:hypothetical protein